jgi:hypothetical protein
MHTHTHTHTQRGSVNVVLRTLPLVMIGPASGDDSRTALQLANQIVSMSRDKGSPLFASLPTLMHAQMLGEWTRVRLVCTYMLVCVYGLVCALCVCVCLYVSKNSCVHSRVYIYDCLCISKCVYTRHLCTYFQFLRLCMYMYIYPTLLHA